MLYCFFLKIQQPTRTSPLPYTTLFRSLESLVLPARLPGYTPALLDELTTAGEVTWTGCGALAGADGWVDRKSTTSELQSRQYLVCRLLLEKKILYYFSSMGWVTDMKRQ